MWAPQTLFEPSSYDDLITGKIPALIVPGILSKTECSSLSFCDTRYLDGSWHRCHDESGGS